MLLKHGRSMTKWLSCTPCNTDYDRDSINFTNHQCSLQFNMNVCNSYMFFSHFYCTLSFISESSILTFFIILEAHLQTNIYMQVFNSFARTAIYFNYNSNSKSSVNVSMKYYFNEYIHYRPSFIPRLLLNFYWD